MLNKIAMTLSGILVLFIWANGLFTDAGGAGVYVKGEFNTELALWATISVLSCILFGVLFKICKLTEVQE